MSLSYAQSLSRVLNLHEDKERGTGRTTQQIEGLRDGSVFVVVSAAQVNLTKRHIAGMTKPPENVEIIVCRNLHELEMRSNGIKKPIVIDHFAQLMMVQQSINAIRRLEEKHKRGI